MFYLIYWRQSNLFANITRSSKAALRLHWYFLVRHCCFRFRVVVEMKLIYLLNVRAFILIALFDNIKRQNDLFELVKDSSSLLFKLKVRVTAAFNYSSERPLIMSDKQTFRNRINRTNRIINVFLKSHIALNNFMIRSHINTVISWESWTWVEHNCKNFINKAIPIPEFDDAKPSGL